MDNALTVGAEAIALIQQTAVDATDPSRWLGGEHVPEPPHVYVLTNRDGSTTKKVADPMPRDYQLDTLDSVRRVVEVFGPDAGNVLITACSTNVVILKDEHERRDRAVLRLARTPQFNTLDALGGDHMSQAEFVRMLRINLDGTLGDSNLLAAARNLRWTATAAVSGSIDHSKESMGRQWHSSVIDAQVTGREALPETVTLKMRVVEVVDIPLEVSIRCAVETFPNDQQLALTAFPGEMTRAVDKLVDWVCDWLTENIENVSNPWIVGSPYSGG